LRSQNPYPFEPDLNELEVVRRLTWPVSRPESAGMCPASEQSRRNWMYIGGGILTILLIILLIYLLT
jgi:hypothetical protein